MISWSLAHSAWVVYFPSHVSLFLSPQYFYPLDSVKVVVCVFNGVLTVLDMTNSASVLSGSGFAESFQPPRSFQNALLCGFGGGSVLWSSSKGSNDIGGSSVLSNRSGIPCAPSLKICIYEIQWRLSAALMLSQCSCHRYQSLGLLFNCHWFPLLCFKWKALSIDNISHFCVLYLQPTPAPPAPNTRFGSQLRLHIC